MYLPYPGFFHKLSMADVFVIMDDVQYDKRFTNRNRILVPQGPLWISVPIVKDDKFHENMLIRDKQLDRVARGPSQEDPELVR